MIIHSPSYFSYFVTMRSSEPCVAETQLELSVADEFFVDILKLEEKLEKMSDKAFTSSQSTKFRTAVAAQVDTCVATAKAVSCIAATNVKYANGSTGRDAASNIQCAANKDRNTMLSSRTLCHRNRNRGAD